MSDYIKGLWIEEKSSKYGEYLQISISLDGLQALTDLPKSEKGYTILFASRQKNDKKKFSCKPAGERQQQAPPFCLTIQRSGQRTRYWLE